jgi:hypothetical protein
MLLACSHTLPCSGVLPIKFMKELLAPAWPTGGPTSSWALTASMFLYQGKPLCLDTCHHPVHNLGSDSTLFLSFGFSPYWGSKRPPWIPPFWIRRLAPHVFLLRVWLRLSLGCGGWPSCVLGGRWFPRPLSSGLSWFL